MKEEKKSSRGGGGSCARLKSAIGSAKGGKARGRALGAYAKAGCAKRKGRRRGGKKHHRKEEEEEE